MTLTWAHTKSFAAENILHYFVDELIGVVIARIIKATRATPCGARAYTALLRPISCHSAKDRFQLGVHSLRYTVYRLVLIISARTSLKTKR